MKTANYTDKNMVAGNNPTEGTLWYEVNAKDMDLYGTVEDGGCSLTARIPEDVAKNTNDGVYSQRTYAAGVRLRFSTDSSRIAIRAEYGNHHEPTCMSVCGIFGFDLYKCDDSGTEKFVHTYRPPADFDHQTLANDPYRTNDNGITYYTLNFPLFSEVKKLYIGIDDNSVLKRGMEYKNSLPVVFYGSSITHGAAASRPGNTYESFISQKYNMNYTNLGFAGAAKAEETMANFLASLKMSIFVSDYDHNAPTPEYLENTHYNLYKIIRQKNPDIPYVMISKPNFIHNPEVSAKRRDIIKASYERAVANGDKNVYFIDGETLLKGEFEESCTIEGIHPNDIGFLRMSRIIGDKLNDILHLK